MLNVQDERFFKLFYLYPGIWGQSLEQDWGHLLSYPLRCLASFPEVKFRYTGVGQVLRSCGDRKLWTPGSLSSALSLWAPGASEELARVMNSTLAYTCVPTHLPSHSDMRRVEVVKGDGGWVQLGKRAHFWSSAHSRETVVGNHLLNTPNTKNYKSFQHKERIRLGTRAAQSSVLTYHFSVLGWHPSTYSYHEK